MRLLLTCWLVFATVFTVSAQLTREQWIDSVFQTLGDQEKIGQLFLARTSSHANRDFIRDLTRKVSSGQLGGLIFTTGTPAKQVHLTRLLQSQASVPLLIAQDGAGGLGHLLDSALAFPQPIVQGAIRNDTLLLEMAREVGHQMRALGVHLSLSPHATPIFSGTVDPTVLYGDRPAVVARKASMHMRGLQDAGILSCARYFPLKSIEVVDPKGKIEIRLYHDTLVSSPFMRLFDQGLHAVVADVRNLHHYFEPRKADLKKKLTEETFEAFSSGNLLHAAIGYEGIIVVDARTINRDELSSGDDALLAFQSGADLIITDEDPIDGIRKIRKLVNSEKRYEQLLERRVRRVLAMKYDAGLSTLSLPDPTFIHSQLNSIASRVLQRRLFSESVTVVRNQHSLLPIVHLDNLTFSCVITGDTTERADIFHRSVRKYIPADRVNIGEEITSPDLLVNSDIILVAVFPGTTHKAFQNLMGALQELAAHQQVVLADFGSPLVAEYAHYFPSLILGYTDEKQMVGIVPQVIFGGLPGEGVLPFRYGDIRSGQSFTTASLDRLSYSFPEDAQVDGDVLLKIDRIAQEAITSGSTPGCYIIVARKGKVIYDKAFGYHTYEQQTPVSEHTIYDLASITKVAATLQAVMFMQEHDLIDIHKKMSVYLPELRGTNKKDVTLADVLTHHAGLAPFVPLWPLTLEGPSLKELYYSSQQDMRYPLQVAPSLFASHVLKDSVWSWVIHSRMQEKVARTPFQYRYSDLGFMMLRQLVERGLNQPLDDFLQQNFYDPLGAYSLGYTPLRRFPAGWIAPTELDTLFRGGLIIGTVHDERAAMLGGISGHAGLFGTANDLSKLGQMLLQEGRYGGVQYFKPETVRLFTARQYASSRRGLGWDKPVPGEWNSPTSIYASPATFGHTGFTGTAMWIDPEFDLVYIFLSNRVFPDRSDKLIRANIRSRIQDVIYEAIFNYCKSYGVAGSP